jgi:iron complex outermembrane receptor protein
MRIDSRRRILLGSAAFAALAIGGAAPAFAQTEAGNPNADPAPAAQTAADSDEAIVVTGFRRSLENAVFEKKSRDQVVESVSAEDIGKLPDASIAESIARLPGLTSQRVSGRSNSISIRGFGPDFSTTLLNGREQTSTGDNRAVEYDQYPSEVVSQVLVYKTPMASLVGQGMSGTVDMRTIRPIEYGRSVVSVGGRGTYEDLGKLNARSRDKGWRVNAIYVDQFANDTMGISLAGSYNDEPYQIQEFNAWGYANTTASGPPFVIGGSKSYVTSTVLRRLGLQGTFEWKPAPNFTTTFDAFYSDFKDDQIKRGVELPLWWGGRPLTNAVVNDGLVTSGTFTGVEGVVRNDAFQRHAKLYSFGWNAAWKGENGWGAMADISYSRTDRNELVLESNAGTGRGAGVGATDTIGFTSGAQGTRFTHQLNYGDYGQILLTSPLGWGGDQTSVDGRRIRGGQDGYYNNRIIKDELWQYRAELDKELDGVLSRLSLGGNYSDRSKRLTPDEAFLGLAANTNGTTSLAVPEQYRLGTTDLTYLGLGPVISYDPVRLLRDGIYQLVPNPYGDVVVKAYDISERLITAYFQGNLDASLGASQLTGNFGVQAIWTNQKSNGASAVYLGQNANGSPNIGAALRHSDVSYVDVLPSANLSLRMPNDWVLRLSAAREIIRSRLDDMRASLNFNYSIVQQGSQIVAFVTGSSGNPELRPWRANALDFTVEKYFGNKGYLAAQFFWKDLKTYIYNQDVDIPTSTLALASPGSGIVIDPTARLSVPINGKGGKMYGVELAGTLPFGDFIPALDGFGLTGSGAYTKSKIHPTPGAPTSSVPGLSKWVVNATGYFEKWGFSARASLRYRSAFVGEVSGFGANRVRRNAVGETILDAQIGYEFQPGSALHGLSVFLQGQNLTDEPFVTHEPGSPLHVIDYQRYGRRYLLGASFKF